MQKSISDKIPEISVVIVGDSQCGKTQLISRLDNKYFSKVYTRTGFNKIDISHQIQNTDVNITVWDTSGGLDGVKSWADEVRKSTNAPLVLVHTKNDEEAENDMEKACEVCEIIGAVNWETASAKTGENIQQVFEHCVSAANVVQKPKIQRPNTLTFSSVKESVSDSSNSPGTVSDKEYHVYENPDELTLTKQTQRGVHNWFSKPTGAKTNGNIARNINFNQYSLESEDDQRKGRDIKHPWQKKCDTPPLPSQSRRSCIILNNCNNSLSPNPVPTNCLH